MMEKNICPGCGRHCDLSNPHCNVGEEYLRTGKVPEQRGKNYHHQMFMESYQAADIDEKLIMLLRDLGHMMRFQHEGKAGQKRILTILSEKETITQRDLTERLGIKPGSASEILSKLENAELIVRTQNEEDRRTTDICLTDTGRKLASEALEQRRQQNKKMFSCISEEEKQKLLSLLEKVCTDWREQFSENDNCGEHERHKGHGRREENGYREGRGRREEDGYHEEHGRHRENGHHEEDEYHGIRRHHGNHGYRSE